MPELKSFLAKEMYEYLKKRHIELSENSYTLSLQVVTQIDGILSSDNTASNIIEDKAIQEWRELLKGKRPKTVSNNISEIRQLLKFIHFKGYQIPVLPESPVVPDDYIPYLYDDVEISRIICAADNYIPLKTSKRPWIGIEFPMILRILFSCGTRITETLSMQVKDIDLMNGVLKLKHTKKKKERIVPMHSDLTEMLKQYCCAMHISTEEDAFVFPGKSRDSCLDKYTFNGLFHRTVQRLGIQSENRQSGQRGACVHVCRNAFVLRSFKQLQKNGLPQKESIPYLSIYLGHDSLYETEKYMKFYNGLFSEEMEKFEKFSDDIYPEVKIDVEDEWYYS